MIDLNRLQSLFFFAAYDEYKLIFVVAKGWALSRDFWRSFLLSFDCFFINVRVEHPPSAKLTAFQSVKVFDLNGEVSEKVEKIAVFLY